MVLSPYQRKTGHPICRKVYDITGFDGQQVVALLSQTVNDQEEFTMNKTFYLLIHASSEENPQAEFEELFRLNARPTKEQPGNAIVFLRPRGNEGFQRRESATSYEELNGALKACYGDPNNFRKPDTKSFARHMKQLFKNNAQIGDLPRPTAEAYMLLLFEIARRLVKIEEPTERKKAFDVLPIGSAIAQLINLLDLRTFTFEEVFFKGKSLNLTVLQEHQKLGERQLKKSMSPP